MKGLIVQNPLRRRTRALTADQYDEVQKLVFDLVRERLVESFGATGMWTVSMKTVSDEQSVFNETVAESLAWSIAAELAPQKKPVTLSRQAPLHAAELPFDELVDDIKISDARAEQLVA